MGAMTPATALLASGIIGASGSLGGGLLSASSASRNNQTALDFNKWSQLQAQQFQQQMYTQQRNDQESFYKKYQSPQAIAAALSQLGVNPAVPLSGGHGIAASPASMPSGMSSPALSAPALQNEGEVMSKSIEAISSAMASIASSGVQTEQSQEALQIFNLRYNEQLLKNNQLELLNAKTEWDMFAAQQKLPYEIQESVMNAYLSMNQGDYTKSLKQLNDISVYIADKCKDMEISTKSQMLTLLGKQITLATEDINLRRAQVQTEKTMPGLNRASAANQRAQASFNSALAKTENALRSGKVELQSLSLDLGTIQKYISGNDLKFSDETLQAKIFGTIEQMFREGLISENVYKEGQILSTRRDWAARQEFANYLGNVVGAASSAFNAFTNYRGVSVSRLNAKERNQIQDKFVDEYVRQSRQNSSARRSAVLGPDYEMYSDQFFGR